MSGIARLCTALQARLVMIAQEQQLAEVAEIRGDMVKAEWGNQIRNYVFHPYKMVSSFCPYAYNELPCPGVWSIKM